MHINLTGAQMVEFADKYQSVTCDWELPEGRFKVIGIRVQVDVPFELGPIAHRSTNSPDGMPETPLDGICTLEIGHCADNEAEADKVIRAAENYGYEGSHVALIAGSDYMDADANDPGECIIKDPIVIRVIQ
jgi:hypothetical protein